MSTTIGSQLPFECEDLGPTAGRGARLLLRSALMAALGLIALAVVAPASEAAVRQAAATYKPRLIGTTRLHKSATGGRVKSILGTVDCPTCDPMLAFDEENFSRPTKIDGKWLPLEPGTQLVLQGQANRGGGLLPHLVIFTVTDLVKYIMGIPCVVVWDQDINEDVLSESELAFFAQDDDGNVWLLGEYPEEYQDGVFVSAENTWISGIEGAFPGITIPAKPVVGTPGFLQARAPENDFWDCGMIFARGKEKTCVPFRCYKDITVVREWAPLDGCDVIQIKTYAKNVGVVQVGAIDDPEGETLVLSSARRLHKREMVEAREAAIALDTHGYEVNDHYAETEPVLIAKKGHVADRDDAEVAQAPVAPLRTFLSIAPNPATASAGIAYGIARAGRVEIGIFDVAGRKVRSLVDAVVPAGTYRAQWDARNDAGRGVGAGVYFARLRTDEQTVGRTIVIAR